MRDDELMESWQVLEWGQPLQKVVGRRPVPHGTEVLVRVSACGVCHSDLHIRDGAYDLGSGRSIELGRIGIHLPLTMGHEILGRRNSPARDVYAGKLRSRPTKRPDRRKRTR